MSVHYAGSAAADTLASEMIGGCYCVMVHLHMCKLVVPATDAASISVTGGMWEPGDYKVLLKVLAHVAHIA